jgi:hypothetical protein
MLLLFVARLLLDSIQATPAIRRTPDEEDFDASRGRDPIAAVFDESMNAASPDKPCNTGCQQMVLGQWGSVQLRKGGDAEAFVFNDGTRWWATAPFSFDGGVGCSAGGRCENDEVLGMDVVTTPNVFWARFHVRATWTHWSEDLHQEVVSDVVTRDDLIGCGIRTATCVRLRAGSYEDDGSAVVLGPALIGVTDTEGLHAVVVSF